MQEGVTRQGGAGASENQGLASGWLASETRLQGKRKSDPPKAGDLLMHIKGQKHEVGPGIDW